MSLNQIKVNSRKVGDLVGVENSYDDKDLIVKDASGYVLCEFADGDFKTKNFDSRDVHGAVRTIDSSYDDVDLYIEDPSRNALVEFKDGYIRTKNFDSAVIVQTDDIPEYADLEVQDSSGNTIVRFMDGHIKTKNFDSENIDIPDIPDYFKVSRFKGKRLAIIGDSISTFSGTMPSGYAVYYPSGDVKTIDKMWWNIVCTKLDMTYTNCAWSSSQVTGAPKGTTAAAGCSDMRINDAGRNGNPDIIIFYIGCNDWAYNTASLGTWSPNDSVIDDSEYTTSQTILDFKAAYSLMLYKASRTYPYARLYCCTNLDDTRRETAGGYPSENGNGVTTYQWNNAIKEVATAMGACIIDLHSCGINYANCRTFMVDTGTHPNVTGH